MADINELWGAKESAKSCVELLNEAWEEIQHRVPETRVKAIVRTKIEEAALWAERLQRNFEAAYDEAGGD